MPIPVNQFSTDSPQSDAMQLACEQYDPDEFLGQPDDDRDLEIYEYQEYDAEELLDEDEMLVELLRQRTDVPVTGYLTSARQLLKACDGSFAKAEEMIKAIFGH